MSLFKNPMTYLYTLIGIVILIIIIMSITGGKENDVCAPGFSKLCGKCVKNCPNGLLYDCATGKCKCPSNESLCGDSCCPEGLCSDGLCCQQERVCLDSSGNKYCCPDGSVCKNNKCIPYCGKDIICDDNQTCLKVENMNQTQKDKFKSDFKGNNVIFENNTGYVCTAKPKCQFSDQYSAPNAIGGIYPCTNIFNQIDDDNNVAYCTSNDPTKAKKCWSNENLDVCKNDKDCIVRVVLDSDITDVNKDIENIQGGNDYPLGTEYKGNYCGEKGTNSKLNILKGTTDSVCQASNCWSELAKDNVTHIDWDAKNNICRSITNCTDGDPDKFSTDCNKYNKTNNPLCQSYDCNDNGSITKSPVLRWVSNNTNSKTRDPNIECTQELISSTTDKTSYATREECYCQTCSPTITDKTDYNDLNETVYLKSSVCCAPGYSYSWQNNQPGCYQQASTTMLTHTDNELKAGIICGKGSFTCHANKKCGCGPQWRARCHGTPGSSCHVNCCNDNPDVCPDDKYSIAKISYNLPHFVKSGALQWVPYGSDTYCFSRDEMIKRTNITPPTCGST